MYQVAATKRPDKFFGASPPPWFRDKVIDLPKLGKSTCGVREVMQNQRLSLKLKYRFSSSSSYFSMLFW